MLRTLINSLLFLVYFQIYHGSTSDCIDRGRNCTSCLSDGVCGFCDSCGDHCRKQGTLHWLENCTGCASCVPGTLTGPQKGFECRTEWYRTSLILQISICHFWKFTRILLLRPFKMVIYHSGHTIICTSIVLKTRFYTMFGLCLSYVSRKELLCDLNALLGHRNQ